MRARFPSLVVADTDTDFGNIIVNGSFCLRCLQNDVEEVIEVKRER